MSIRFSYFSAALVAATAAVSGISVPEQQVSLTAGAADTWNADWSGVPNRTYFFQWSQDLTQWNYAPFVEFGSGVKSFGFATQNAPKFFVRLQQIDDTAVTSLQQAREGDRDNDGLPNFWEVSNGLNPMSALGNDGSTGDLDGDGYNNLREYYLESNPNDINDCPQGMVAAKDLHSVALTADGRVWSWGYNGSGELGDGTTVTRNAPVPLQVVAGMAKVLRVDTGRYFGIALDENGVLWGWGSNSNHQISKDAIYQYLTPFKIEMSAPVARFACGTDHVLAVDRTGRLWSWGINTNGQLGLGHTNSVSGVFEIIKPSGMGLVVSVTASGSNSFAVDAAGKIWSWGHNGNGELGDGTNTNRNSPVAVDNSTGIPAVKSIKAGDIHAMAAGVDGSIWTWGYNGSGQLGNGDTFISNKPVKITSGLSAAMTLGAGSQHSLAVSPSGSVWAWGDNSYGQLGVNSTISKNVPSQTATIVGWSDIRQVAGGLYHSIAMKSDGSIWSWGRNSYGQLGIDNTIQQLIPTQIMSLKLIDNDSDTDGLPDSWEQFYFGNLLQTGSSIYVANGVTNQVAYAVGLNPTMVDNDNDGISNAAEIAANLDPLDWSDATGDLDGDRIPNLWEVAMGSSMTDPAFKPAVTATVSTGQSIQAAIIAVVGNRSNPPWAIIQVQPGVYAENINIPSDKRILLIPTSASGIPEIQGTTSSATVTLYGESVLDGFRITHATGVAGYGVYASQYLGLKPVRIMNCLIYDHSGSNGRGIHGTSCRLVIANCSVFRNSAIEQGNGLHVKNGARAMVMNSIFWNPSGQATEEVYNAGITEARQTMVRDGSVAGASTENPLLNPLGLLTKASPARGKGTSKALAFRDIHGESRGTQPDIGADQFIDTDNDGLPDFWEMTYFGNLTKIATEDNDTPIGDRLINEYEYLFGFDPTRSNTLGSHLGDLFDVISGFTNEDYYPLEWRLDSDGDGFTNGQELYYGTSPFNVDTNGDGISDWVAVFSGINPVSNDIDGDGIANSVELANGTNPLLADTDGDGVNDNLDSLPLDPNVWSLPAPLPNDVTAPIITLQKPSGAVSQP